MFFQTVINNSSQGQLAFQAMNASVVVGKGLIRLIHHIIIFT